MNKRTRKDPASPAADDPNLSKVDPATGRLLAPDFTSMGWALSGDLAEQLGGPERGKRVEGGRTRAENVRKRRAEKLDPLLRSIWAALVPSEKTLFSVALELKLKHEINRSESQLRRDFKRLQISVS